MLNEKVVAVRTDVDKRCGGGGGGGAGRGRLPRPHLTHMAPWPHNNANDYEHQRTKKPTVKDIQKGLHFSLVFYTEIF